jgi:hypothetical protein
MVPLTFLGQSITCGGCQLLFVASAPETTTDSPPEDASEAAVTGTSPWLLIAMIGLGLLVSFGVGVLGVILFANYAVNNSWPARNFFGSTKPADESENDVLVNPERWTDASKRSMSFAGAMVTIDRVMLSPVRFQAVGENRITEDRYLLVNVTVVNQSRAELHYKSITMKAPRDRSRLLVAMWKKRNFFYSPFPKQIVWKPIFGAMRSLQPRIP